ncbi:hypothetical protein SS50377_28631 [Spironucleus salmonicida]|uniref:Uncharacterized protein n=1 Tax=Spironucleus salmonicida TaxID=348837 RepID=A0A9P8RUI9_9EUKA|nr:hypothetical protein SS50377_28631 [Spironucleus salmonicida]
MPVIAVVPIFLPDLPLTLAARISIVSNRLRRERNARRFECGIRHALIPGLVKDIQVVHSAQYAQAQSREMFRGETQAVPKLSQIGVQTPSGVMKQIVLSPAADSIRSVLGHFPTYFRRLLDGGSWQSDFNLMQSR